MNTAATWDQSKRQYLMGCLWLKFNLSDQFSLRTQASEAMWNWQFWHRCIAMLFWHHWCLMWELNLKLTNNRPKKMWHQELGYKILCNISVGCKENNLIFAQATIMLLHLLQSNRKASKVWTYYRKWSKTIMWKSQVLRSEGVMVYSSC